MFPRLKASFSLAESNGKTIFPLADTRFIKQHARFKNDIYPVHGMNKAGTFDDSAHFFRFATRILSPLCAGGFRLGRTMLTGGAAYANSEVFPVHVIRAGDQQTLEKRCLSGSARLGFTCVQSRFQSRGSRESDVYPVRTADTLLTLKPYASHKLGCRPAYGIQVPK